LFFSSIFYNLLVVLLRARMIWITIWFIVYNIELFLWAYIVYLHFEEKILRKPKMNFPKQTKVVVRTKKDIVRG